MKRAKVGVIVPVYNVEKYLGQCIESLLKQTLRDIQIVLIDDGSIDSSGEIIDKYAQEDERIVAIHKANGGISSARNEGIKYISAEYLTFVDSDDWIDSNMYLHMYEAACSTGADIVSTDANNQDVVTIEDNIILSYLLHGDVSCCNKIFRFTEEIKNSFRFDSHNVSIDVKGCFDFFKNCKKWTIIPGAYYNYRQDNISYGRSGFSPVDVNSVTMTVSVADEAKQISDSVYRAACFHVLHAKFDVLNKVAVFGYKKPEYEAVFSNLCGDYVKDIRKALIRCLLTSYFSKNEKMQLCVISISWRLFYYMKRAYTKKHAGDPKIVAIKC